MVERRNDLANDILTFVKESIGISAGDDGFDSELAPTIDGFLADLVQIGCGVDTMTYNGISIIPRIRNKKDLSWEEFFGPVRNLAEDEAIKYVRLKCKLQFDPPLPATIKWYEDSAQEAYIRARTGFDV